LGFKNPIPVLDTYRCDVNSLKKLTKQNSGCALVWDRKKKTTGNLSEVIVMQLGWLVQPRISFLPTVPCSTAPLIGITGQFADKPTRGQSSRVWINSRTAIFFKLRKHCNKIIIYLCTKQKPNTTLTISTTVSVQWCNLPQITFTAIVYAANFKSNVSASWLVREL